MYDAHAALAAIDQNTTSIMACLLITVAFAFIYFLIAFRMAFKQKVYVVPFVGAAVFFWHDLTFVLMFDTWFNVYDHWWVKMWWYALCGTVVFEILMLWQVWRYGREELWPKLSSAQFGWMIVLGTLGCGALWFLVKFTIHDPLFFTTFAITAIWSVPFHTGIMARRQSRAGQSIAMEVSVIIMISSLTGAFAQIDPFFRSPVFLAFVAAFIAWPLFNIWLIRRLPPVTAEPATLPKAGWKAVAA
ncbi:MAG TPA: hypothetical protein VJM11_13845 [Nevskiaceae bacterium]|nr:hypothetical protein [Nevskiaceae bacterium]